ncbi:MAG: hypothetical protein AB1941_14935 [Gemmatimonadota bacterium]
MKCIHCGTDTRGPDRASNGGRCSGCRHRFAFEPLKDPLGITDGLFHGAVQRVSGDGSVAFTDRQLWYELNRRWMRPAFWQSPLPWLARLLGRRARKSAAPAAPPPRLPFEHFVSDYLARWPQAHGPVHGLVDPRPATPAAQLPSIAADVSAFSFDRAVVTDRWETAAMLVANRFHFEHNCAVLSRDGFPEAIGGTVKTMLRRNPQLTVFALHDASPSGCLLPLDLRGPDWFPEPTVRVVDLGLRPETAKRLKLPVLNQPVGQLPPRLSEILPPEDLGWLLAGNLTELAALRPAQVLRAAYDGIRRVGHPGDPASVSGADSGSDVGYYGYPGIIWVGDVHDERRDTATVDGFG